MRKFFKILEDEKFLSWHSWYCRFNDGTNDLLLHSDAVEPMINAAQRIMMFALLVVFLADR